MQVELQTYFFCRVEMKKTFFNLFTLIHIEGSSQGVFDVDAQRREGPRPSDTFYWGLLFRPLDDPQCSLGEKK